jgi:hypothetical protein
MRFLGNISKQRWSKKLKCDEKESKREKAFEPKSPYVIVCEGFQDSGLICALLKQLQITNCDVTYPKKRRDGANGKDAIFSVLYAVSQQKVAGENLRGLAVIRDADDNPKDSFEEAAAKFPAPYAAPEESFKVERAKYRTGIFLIPGKGKTGTLEHLLLDAVAAKNPPVLECVNKLETCANWRVDWSSNKTAKMKMHSVVASFCKDDPGCSLGFIWSKKADNPMDIASPVFKELADFLRAFSQ